MLIYIAADHRGFKLKEVIKNLVKDSGYQIVDLGAEIYDPTDDYPVYAAAVAQKISLEYESARGILICGSGAGVDIVANKFKNVRSVLAISPDHAVASKNDDDTNVLAIAADYMDERTAKQTVSAWLQTSFSKESRHKRRIAEITEIESKNQEENS